MEVYRQRTVKRWREIFHSLAHTKTTGAERRKSQHQLILEKSRYDKSMVWKTVRDAKLESTDYRCEECGEQAEIMQVHHLTYDRIGGKELDEDLESKCKYCHGAGHGYGKPKQLKSVNHPDRIVVKDNTQNRKKVLDMMNSGDVYWESFHRIYGW